MYSKTEMFHVWVPKVGNTAGAPNPSGLLLSPTAISRVLRGSNNLYICIICTFTATHYLNYLDLLPYWPRSSVGRASIDLIRRIIDCLIAYDESES